MLPATSSSVRVPLKKRLNLSSQDIERDFTSSLRGNILPRGLSRSALYSAMAWFLPTVTSIHADNGFGPRIYIYTRSSLELALRYPGAQGALMVFQTPDFRDLNEAPLCTVLPREGGHLV